MNGPVHEEHQRVAGPTRADPLAQTLRDLIEQRVAAAPDRPVLYAPGRPALDYRGLADQVRCIAGVLGSAGIGRGDVVAVLLPNGPELAVAILGTACAATAAPLNPAAPCVEIERLLDEVRAKAVIVSESADLSLRRAAGDRGLPTLELAAGERAGELTIAAPAATAPQKANGSDVALLLHTSGTAARPKQVPLTHRNLVGAAARVVESMRLGAEDRCLSVMPLVHAHGLIGGLLPSLRAGGSVICTTTFDPREALALAREHCATWTTAAPAVYRVLLEAEGPLPRFRFMRSASAPMPPDLAASLEERFDAPLVEVYGMTEAYQVAANPFPPGERRPGSVGRATGTEVAIVDEAGEFVGAGEAGEIVLRGPGVFLGYRGAEEVNDRAFLHGWFRTGDAGVLGEDGYLTITGRLREIINRGGEKIAPREVEHALAQHPEIREVVCFPVPDAGLGEEIGALVVPADGTTLDPGELRRFAASRLAPTKVPRWFRFQDRIPAGDGGKPNRATMAQRLGFDIKTSHREASLPSEVGRSADVRAELRHLWMEILSIDEPPRDEDRFFDLGGTSLGLVELLVEVERRFGVRLQLGAILEAPSVAELAARIEGTSGPVSVTPDRIEVEREEFTATVVPIRATGTRPPFFVVSPAGGSVLAYYHLAHALGPEQPFYGLEVALRRRGPRVHMEVGDIAEAFLEGMRCVNSQRPWCLGGWSFGGFVAWEMADRLRSRGEEVSQVVLVDSDASRLGQPPTFKDAVQGVGLLGQGIWYAKPFLRDTLHVRLAASLRGKRKTGPLRRALRSLLWKAGIERADIAPYIERDPRLLEVRTTTWGILRNIGPFVRAARRYRPPIQQLDLDLIRAGYRDDSASARDPIRRTLGWERFATGRIHVHPVEGNHFTILDSDHVNELAGTLSRILADPRSRETGLPDSVQ